MSPRQGHETPFTSGPYSFKGPDPCPTQPSTPGAAISARAAALAAAAAALAGDQPKGSPEGPTPRPFSPPPVSMVAEASSELSLKSGFEQHTSSLPPTSSAEVGMFCPCRLPPKFTNTRDSRLGDGPGLSRDGLQRSGVRLQLFGDKPPIPEDVCGHPSSEQFRFSGDRPRPSEDGPQIVRKPLFRVCLPLLL